MSDFRKGDRVCLTYRNVIVKGRISILKKNNFALVILDQEDADLTMASAIEVSVTAIERVE